jgi:hypothetical protein
MSLKRPKGPAGTLVVLEHSSSILKGNPLGDPHVRKVGVWLPPQYDGSGKKRFPVLYDLVGFTGSGLSHTSWKPFGDIDADPETLITFNGLSPAAARAAGFDHQRALVTIEFFKLDDVSGRKDLFIDRARVIIAMYPQLVNLGSADAATRASAQGVVPVFTRPTAPQANCARSFQRLFASDPAKARALSQAASDYLISNS